MTAGRVLVAVSGFPAKPLGNRTICHGSICKWALQHLALASMMIRCFDLPHAFLQRALVWHYADSLYETAISIVPISLHLVISMGIFFQRQSNDPGLQVRGLLSHGLWGGGTEQLVHSINKICNTGTKTPKLGLADACILQS